MSPIDPHENKEQSKSIAEAVLLTLQTNASAALLTMIEVPVNVEVAVGSKLLVNESGSQVGSLGSEELNRVVGEHVTRFLESRADTRVVPVKEFAPQFSEWSEAKILFERIQAEPRLVICGAGHVGASLAKLASLMGYRTTLIDDREEFVSRKNFSEQGINLVAATNWSADVKTAVGTGLGVSVAIVTRGHSEDEQCLSALIALDVDYIGMIGSKRRTNIVLQRLRENGAEEERLARVHAPVGLDIGAVTPEEVALAIMAEVVAVRRGGKGGSLSEWRRE
jgi:xanthine dehydrogenase accessory factor